MSDRPLGSTYRLQLQGLGLAGARELVPYLHHLGVETLYVSPLAAAAPGSTHGYDVVDPGRLDPALGGRRDLERLLDDLDRHGMRLLVDTVPNHMAAVAANRRWWDVLRHGPRSRYAGYFDIDWAAGDGKVVLPVLEAPLADVLGAGGVTLVTGGRHRELAVGGLRLPLRPGTRVRDRGGVAAVLAHQHYRLVYWRLGPEVVNYRRFFDIDGLVGVRVEDPAVFGATHRLALALAADRRVAGLRLDHVDGLADPADYLRRLRAAVNGAREERPVLVVEKILARGEELPPGWPVDGTTGYEFCDLAGALFVDPAGAAALAGLGRRTGGPAPVLAELVAAAKRQVLAESFPAPFDRLCGLAAAALDTTEPGLDLPRAAVDDALRALTVHLPAYRTYLAGPPSAADRDLLARAADAARADLDAEGVRALEAICRGLAGPAGSRRRPGPWAEVARRWQQLTGAVTAKGVEDTAWYRWTGLLAGAEVGGDPAEPALEPAQVVPALVARARGRTASLNATSTHDTKRSEDTRARLWALSEAADEWAALVARWRRRHAGRIARAGGPDPADELLCYQTIYSVWPDHQPVTPAARRALAPRVAEALRKSVREAKRRSSWRRPDEAYEKALLGLAGWLVRDGGTFPAEMGRLVGRLGPAAATGSLALVVLKVVLPGVPDVYQGTELWDRSLVDPDNRRPVDFDARRSMLASLGEGPGGVDPEALLSSWRDGALKLHVLATCLRHRRDQPALFERGRTHHVAAAGPRRSHLVALSRSHRGRWVLAVVPRLPLAVGGPGRFPLASAWRGTRLSLPEGAPGRWVDLVTGDALTTGRGGRLAVDQVLARCPVALLAPGD